MEQRARSGKTMSYLELTAEIDALSYRPQSGELSKLLSEISLETHKHEKGLLSAVVVHADDGRPGKGFYALGRDLGFTFDDDVKFWQEQVEKVHQIWGASPNSSVGQSA